MRSKLSLFALLLLSCSLALACARRSEQKAYARELTRAHALADRATTESERRTAARTLEHAFDREPEGPAETSTPLRQDLADRIARLYLHTEEPQLALTWARRGLAITEAESVLRATLQITEADALEALGDRDAARASLMSALETNQALLNVELEHP